MLQSSIASKSILRAVADDCARRFDFVDYFPSFEIIAGPAARGVFFEAGGRDVTHEGVKLVMDVFFASRIEGAARRPVDATAPPAVDTEARLRAIGMALAADCDEVLLDGRS